MKKKMLFASLSIIMCLSGCGQDLVTSYGVEMTIELPANQKLEEIIWKDYNDLWYLTRPMREDEDAETHTFQQSSNWGIFEGTITIIEKKE